MTDVVTEARTTTLAVYPIADYPEDNLERLMDESLRPEDTIDLCGHCTTFCAHDLPRSSSVDEHGPWCSSLHGAALEGRDATGADFSIFANLVSLYTHGVYRRSQLTADKHLWHEPLVRLGLISKNITPDQDDDEAANFFLTVGDARRLAAGLTYLADAADHLLGDLNRPR